MLTVSDGDGQQVFDLSPEAEVRLNGAPASVQSLQSGDSLTVELDDQHHVISVDVHRIQAGIILQVSQDKIELTTDYTDRHRFRIAENAALLLNGAAVDFQGLQRGDHVQVFPDPSGQAVRVEVTRQSALAEFWDNFRHNLFKPLLLFFYMGFSVPLLKIAFEFPHVIYQGLTMYLLISIGWHGGEELADLSGGVLKQALLFMMVGFFTNFVIGSGAYGMLRKFIPRMRRVDAATVAAYYGSDSAGTFVTCLGVLVAANIKYAAYMPVMLAVMEIPGCLVGLVLVAKLRTHGMDALGNMPDEPGYIPPAPLLPVEHTQLDDRPPVEEPAVVKSQATGHGHGSGAAGGIFNAELLREVFFNPGLFLLFGGILIGFVSRLQGHKVTDADDSLFVNLFQGMLCLFLLEMGMTASKRLKDLQSAGWRFILFGLLAPNLFATFGIAMAHLFSMLMGAPLQLGTYALFAVLCGAASYIAVPAIQRLAIPEASPTLPLAASLGLTFSYNVTIGIPIYILISQLVIMAFPVHGA
ncbi:MAG: sodium-dependent bicarbonate transport family permease [Planctomycetes bacterium]|nr:sodium-dependent bicarbonate transport family permease [Planctomycetota bacterium]